MYRGKKNFHLLSTLPFQISFTVVNWSVLEAGHGKGPGDGVRATIKRSEDSLVAKGIDLPSAKILFETLLSLRKINRFYVEDKEIQQVPSVIPNDLPSVKGTLVIRITHGTIHCELSCFRQ